MLKMHMTAMLISGLLALGACGVREPINLTQERCHIQVTTVYLPLVSPSTHLLIILKRRMNR